jgi:signal-transduction protein with cAMP-binding, CBS, and nucleotidyltransferase domain
MLVGEAMSHVVLTVGPAHTLRDAARQMSQRRVGAAVVLNPEAHHPGILTERDVLDAIGAGLDPDAARVADHLTADIMVAAPAWPVQRAAAAMVAGGFRHLVVCEGGEVVGMLSVRDVVQVWTETTDRLAVR